MGILESQVHALHVAGASFIPSITFGPWLPPGVIPEHRAIG